MVYPLFVMVMSSFKTNAEIFTSPFALPHSFSPRQRAEGLDADTNFVRYLANSIGVTGASIVLIVIFSTMAAYAIARYEFRGNALMLMFFLSGMTVPLKLAIIPLFIQLDTLHLIDSYAGLVLVYVAMGIPSAVFIMTGFLRSLPRELEEAPRIDGASELQVMMLVMLPLARPAHGDRGDPECSADLERLLLPLDPDHFGQPEDPAPGADRFHGRVHHQLGRALHRPVAGRFADHLGLYRLVPAFHRRHHPGCGEVGPP